MSGTVVVTSSSCDLPAAYMEKYNIVQLPLKVIYPDREYLDGVDITPSMLYSKMPEEIPSSSMPSVGDIEKIFSEIFAGGADRIFAVAISSGLSGTYNGIQNAALQFPGKVTIVDSLSVSIGHGFLVLEAARLLEAGYDVDEVKRRLLILRGKAPVFFVLKGLEYLKKGGRIGYVSSTIGDFLDIKPIISVNPEGKYYMYSKPRGREKSLRELKSIGENAFHGKRMRIAVLHGNAQKEAELIRDSLALLPDVEEMIFYEIGPVLGVHTGPGLVGVSYHPVDYLDED